MNIDLREAFLRIDVSRLERISPYVRAAFLSLRKLPPPQLWSLCSPEESSAAAESYYANNNEIELSEAQRHIVLFLRLSESLKQWRFDEAIACASDLAALYPQDHVIRFVLGFAHFGAGNFESCLTVLSESLALNPDFDLAKAALVFLYALTRDNRRVLALGNVVKQIKSVKKYWAVGDFLEFAVFQAKFVIEQGGRADQGRNKVASAIEMAAWLPEFREVLSWGEAPPKEAIFVFCDSTYFKKFVATLILSVVDKGAAQAVHAHIVNPDEEALTLAATLSGLMKGRLRLTVEDVDMEPYCHPRVYYVAVRYCRVHEFFMDGDTDYVVLDADMLIHRVFTFEEVRQRAGSRCVFAIAPHEPMWGHFLGGFGIYTRDDPGSIEVLECISWFIMENVKRTRGAWYLDQIAIFVAASSAPGSWGAVESGLVYDFSHRDETLVWTVADDKDVPAFVAEQRRLTERYLGS